MSALDWIEEKNAVITNARFDLEHGILSAWITLDYGGNGQGFGGYALYLPSSFTHSSPKGNYCGHFIWRVFEIAGVQDWRDLVGKTIRVRSTNNGVIEIGHIIKNDWFNPKREFEAMEGNEV